MGFMVKIEKVQASKDQILKITDTAQYYLLFTWEEVDWFSLKSARFYNEKQKIKLSRVFEFQKKKNEDVKKFS